MWTSIKFNVIIPTRERADTLFHCLRTVVAQDYENLNIIVSDNFSQDNTREVVASFSDPRIKYINTGKRVSMSHNWEFALGHVAEGWVTIVGDDDGLLPGALATVAGVIKKTGCQAIASQWCYYYWPNSGIWDNSLTVPLTSGIELRNGREWLGKLMRGDADFSDLPCLYTGGFVDTLVINRARGSSGAFFLSMTPDIYSAIALASVLVNYVMLKEPIAVAGLSSHSTGASGLGIGKNLVPAQKFFSEENIPFHSTLAGGEVFKSIPIAVYECYLQSTHLHHDFLKIRLEDQIGLALSRVKPQYYADLRKYCSQIACGNEIDMDVVDQKTRKLKKRLCLQQFKKIININYLFRQRTIPCNEFGIQDVYGAVFLAKAAFLLETHYTHWKLDNLFRLMRKILQHILGSFGRK